jgi:GDP-mannose 6-dehydrogenase
MRITVFGLGYVGCVSAACFADMGHDVIGVDVDPRKLAMLRRGEPPVIEPGLDDLLRSAFNSGRLTVTDVVENAIRQSEVSIVCVGTPSRPNGSLDSRYVERVIDEIGAALANRSEYHVVTVRSTLLPGMLTQCLIPRLEAASGKPAGRDYGVCQNPEFLRESTAIRDFQSPPFTLIGELDARSGDRLAEAYAGVLAPIYRVPPEAAAMVKYASNAYHALKVTFSNEIGALCRQFDVNSQEVMDVFVRDTHLNVSAAYLRPGFAFGGSCLPKDVRALLYAAKQQDVHVPLLSAVIPSNDLHIQRVVDAVQGLNSRRVALVGLSFKPGTDDLRESPLVRLAESLIGKGHRLSIYDPDVSLSNLFGRNRDYIDTVLPHLGELLCTDARQAIDGCKVVVVGKVVSQQDEIRTTLTPGHTVVDLTRSNDWSPATQITIV